MYEAHHVILTSSKDIAELYKKKNDKQYKNMNQVRT